MRKVFMFAIVVPAYDDGITFFCDALGFDLIKDEDQGDCKRWVVVRAPGGGADILIARAAGGVQTAAIGQQTGGRVGFFLSTPDFDATYADMRAKGVIFEETPRAEPYGKVAVFQDPWGNRWDLLEEMS